MPYKWNPIDISKVTASEMAQIILSSQVWKDDLYHLAFTFSILTKLLISINQTGEKRNLSVVLICISLTLSEVVLHFYETTYLLIIKLLH